MHTPILPHIKAICFDLDNTLFDRQTSVTRLFQSYLSASSHPPETHANLLRQMLSIDALGYTPREVCNAQLAALLGSPWTPARIWQHMTAHWPQSAPQPRECALIKILSRHYEVGLLSNGSSHNQRAKLNAMGATTLFPEERIWISQELQATKPDSKAFAAVIRGFDVAPREILYVGDHPTQDIVGAHRTGLSTGWVSLGRSLPNTCPIPDMIVSHAIELQKETICSSLQI